MAFFSLLSSLFRIRLPRQHLNVLTFALPLLLPSNAVGQAVCFFTQRLPVSKNLHLSLDKLSMRYRPWVERLQRGTSLPCLSWPWSCPYSRHLLCHLELCIWAASRITCDSADKKIGEYSPQIVIIYKIAGFQDTVAIFLPPLVIQFADIWN